MALVVSIYTKFWTPPLSLPMRRGHREHLADGERPLNCLAEAQQVVSDCLQSPVPTPANVWHLILNCLLHE